MQMLTKLMECHTEDIQKFQTRDEVYKQQLDHIFCLLHSIAFAAAPPQAPYNASINTHALHSLIPSTDTHNSTCPITLSMDSSPALSTKPNIIDPGILIPCAPLVTPVH